MKEMLSNILLIALGRSVLKGQYYFFEKNFCNSVTNNTTTNVILHT